MPCDDRFCWDDNNLWKIEERFDHEEVQDVFDDEHRMAGQAYRGEYRGEPERRETIFGETYAGRVLAVVYTWRDDRIRVISARLAGPKERLAYWDRRRQR